MIDEMVDSAKPDVKALRFKQAHAMLHLFNTDCGRAAVTLEEIKEWASAQEDEQLRSRVHRFLSSLNGPPQG